MIPATIGVVVAAYNAAETLPETLASLESQTWRDWQAIIVDDGSDDQTASIAAKFAARDDRIQVLPIEHAGVSAARNAGLERLQTDWVVFLDADDIWAPEFMQALLAHADQATDAVYCAFQRESPDGAIIGEYFEAGVQDEPFEVLARRNPLAIHSVLVRTARARAAGGFDPKLASCEDWDFWQRLARMGAVFRGLPEPLATYRVRDGSLSGRHAATLEDGLRVLERGHGADPRIAASAPQHRDGLAAEDFYERAGFLALWYAGAEVGAGRDGADLLGCLKTPLCFGTDMGVVANTLIEGAAIGARATTAAVATQLSEFPKPLRRLLDAIAAALPPYQRASMYRRFEAALLSRLPLGVTRSLTSCARACVEVADLQPIDLPTTVDSLQLDFLIDGGLAASVVLPVLGGLSARDVAEAAVAALGEQRVRRSAKPHRAAGYWVHLGGAALTKVAANVGEFLHGRRPARKLFRGARGQAKVQALLATYGASRSQHASRLAEYCSALGETPPDTPSVVTTEGRRWTGRNAYWEGIFAKADPWNYGSVYEQTKYDQTLELIGVAPIGNALELACAEGHFTPQLAGRAGRLIAADISETALQRAAERCAGLSNVEFRRVDLISDQLPGEQDLIVCSEVLYYVEGLDRLPGIMAKLRDALAPGGRLVMAHYFLLDDDRACTGFDWEQAYGAKTIHETAIGTAGLRLSASTVTDLYRIDCFERAAEGARPGEPAIRRARHGEPLDLDVERAVVWGGAKEVRRELMRSRSTWTVPVLMYHRVSDEGPEALKRWRVTPDMFRAQMCRLRQLGYHTVTSADLLRHRDLGEPLPGRPALITFDDAYADFEENAWPILQRCDLGAEVFVVTDRVGGVAQWDADAGEPASLMDWPALRRLAAQGATFGSHMASHARASELPTAALLEEAVRSRAALQRELQKPVRSIAAPYGELDDRFLWAIEKAGYRINFTTEGGVADIHGRLDRTPRVEVWGHWTADDLERALGAAERWQAPASAGRRLDQVLVTVVIPAYNAETSIDETLRSVRGQTHTALEILVVDDGSRDGTVALVEQHAAEDPRVRLIRQTNAGVAAARNRGIAEARAELIAPIDADDLWAPMKIEKQLRMMDAGGETMGLVYSWYATIDAASRVTDRSHTPSFQGRVLRHICLGNFVGNGSSPLMRKRAILECGGYATALRDQNAQGCEDLLLYFRIAERYDYGVTPEHLTGYRQLPEAMSGDVFQMLRSFRLVSAEMRARRPEFTRETRSGEAHLASWLFWKVWRAGKLRSAGGLAWVIWRRDPKVGLALLSALTVGLMRRLRGRRRQVEGYTRFVVAEGPMAEAAQ